VPHRGVTGVDAPRNAQGQYTAPLGLEKDPLGVFSVVKVDGAPAIRISGQIVGALTTRDQFESYHLRLEFRWGDAKWPPRQDQVRDSGLLYLCHGPHGGADNGAWMESLEMQIQEHDVGDYYGVGGVAAETRGTRAGDLVTYQAGGQPFEIPSAGITRRIVKSEDAERPVGAWNVLDLYVVGDAAVHVVNGKRVLAVTGIRTKSGDRSAPLTRGRIQLQSEWAEIFYRRITLTPISAFPAEWRP
jgi:hypothetical protein